MAVNRKGKDTERTNQEIKLDPCSQQCIRAFSDIFFQVGFREPVAAATYYTAITQSFLKPFKQINKSIKLAYPNSKLNLQAGKEDLLNYGFLAEIYLADEADFRNQFEAFLPVNPWLIAEIKGKLTHIADEDKLAIKKLSDIYEDKFGKNGLATKKGSITALYDSRWLYYTLMNYVENNKVILMTFGRLKSFESPYLDFYLKMFKENLQIKGIYNTNDESLKQKALKLNKDFKKNIKIKFTDIDTIALRRLIANRMAIDARKVIGRSVGKPSYVGTIYLEKEAIKHFRTNFNALYHKSSEV